MRWTLSHRADPRALPLADRHYNRQKPGTPQFVPPGRCVVLLTPEASALFEHVGFTEGGLWAFQLAPDRMPDAEPPIGGQLELMESA